MERVIVIANQKGGVGKTTTSINLSDALAVMEKKVLVVDCDPQANCTSGLGLDLKDLKNNLYSVFFDPAEAHKAIHTTKSPFLSILPATTDLVGVEIELVEKIGREYYLSEVIKAVEADYEYIIIDCPPSLGLLTLNSLCAAKELLIPLQCEYFALEGIVKLIQTYNLVKKRLNKELEILGVLLTMYDSRNNLAKEVKTEVRRRLPDYLLETVIPRNVRLSEAPSHGKSILHYDVKSRGADAYIALAREIIMRYEHS